MKIKKKIVLITGSSGGIGSNLVECFNKSGYKVLALDFNSKNNIKKNIYGISCDLNRFVMNEVYSKNILKKINKHLNNDGLDVLINNAAVQIIGNLDSIDKKKWQKTLDVNLTAPFLLIKYLIKSLKKKSGSIINISSIHAKLTKKNFLAYSTSKAALSSMTKALAIDIGSDIQINAIEPGGVLTPMYIKGLKNKKKNINHLKRKVCKPSELASFILAIVKGKYKFLNGSCLEYNGGVGNILID